MSDCRSYELLPACAAAPPVLAISIVVRRAGRPARSGPAGDPAWPSASVPGFARRGLVPFVFASVLLHLAAVCLATTIADTHPDWFRIFRPSFRRGAVSVELAASVASPRRENSTPVRVVPPNPVPHVPAEPIERRDAPEPSRPSAAFAVAAVGTRVPLPQVEANRSAATETPPAEPLESAVPPPKQATEQMPRVTEVAMESVASTGATASSGVSTLETPTKLFRIEPRYPAESLARREEGLVKVRVLLRVDGRVAEAEVVESSGFPLLDASALATAYLWRFPPIEAGDKRYAVEWIEKVRFRIKP
jgi:TonB family protein